jgi:hypothetical protein
LIKKEDEIFRDIVPLKLLGTSFECAFSDLLFFKGRSDPSGIDMKFAVDEIFEILVLSFAKLLDIHIFASLLKQQSLLFSSKPENTRGRNRK